MKKRTINESVSAMNRFSSKMPKTITEAINFEGLDNSDDMGMMGGEEEQPQDQEMGGEDPEMVDKPEEGGDDLNVESFINETRKRALKIMAKLADTPDNPIYDLSKRIWQICDKAYNDQKEQEQMQNGGMQQKKF